MGQDQSFVALVGQRPEKVLDQQGLAHAIGAVEQTTGAHGHQLFEPVVSLLEGFRSIGAFHRRAKRQLAGTPEALKGRVQVRWICRGVHSRGRYRFWH